jgi:hypothetical protein
VWEFTKFQINSLGWLDHPLSLHLLVVCMPIIWYLLKKSFANFHLVTKKQFIILCVARHCLHLKHLHLTLLLYFTFINQGYIECSGGAVLSLSLVLLVFKKLNKWLVTVG